MSNQMKDETSPYLLQHSENPVNWYPWCEKAFEKAKAQDKPIFLSIGYSTCHWCHVMAHESFEDEKTAEILNNYFISIKVDREERPDIDSVYMAVCQAFTGSGGWPMSIFMTWDKKPFFAGMYFPAKAGYGRQSFCGLLSQIIDVWKNNRNELLQSADTIIRHLKSSEKTGAAADNENVLENAVYMFKNSFDSTDGGFGAAPKFPSPHNLLFLMLYSKQYDRPDVLQMAEKTLLQMRKGGIFDQIGYGFSRYSTDSRFLVPHFEKMLYDNALLIMAYAAAYHLTDNPIFLDTAEKTAAYVLREMTSLSGGFYSAQDADSEGVEGKYYTFTFGEVISVLGGEKGRAFAAAFDITEEGNFEGKNIPNLLKSGDLTSDYTEELHRLYEYRKSRAKLHLDDKILTSWNALMIAALAMLYRASKNETYLNAAKKAQELIEKELCSGAQLYTSCRDRHHSDKAFLDDYAFYTAALLELYHATLDSVYLENAEHLCAETVKKFACRTDGGFHLCETDSTELFINPKETYDGAVPSGNSVMAYNFVRLYQLTEKEKYQKSAEIQLGYLSAQAQAYPSGYCMFLLAKIINDNPPEHIIIVPKGNITIQPPFFKNIIITQNSEEYPLLNDKTTYYVCKNKTCFPPQNSL